MVRPYWDVDCFCLVASCLNVYCGEHGQCYGDPDGAAACVCDDNHFGARCQYNGSNLCDAPNVRQCHGHGTCDIFLLNAGSPTARCKCDLENIYQDLSFCSELDPDNNPCYFTNPCLNGGNCVPSINNYTCACPPSKLMHHTHTHSLTIAHTPMYIHTHKHSHPHTYVYTHLHTHTYTHTYT